MLGNYVYADGAANVRVAGAVDALTVRLHAERPDVALGFLATPTDVFAVPPDAVAQSARAYAARSRAAKLGSWPLRTLSGGRLLRRAYPPGADPGICDALIPQQGPNYALAKRVQRWRATVAHDAGATVSMNVAPPTRTRSVTKNRALAAAYAGAHRFGVEVFEPATTKTLMAALLVHDLHTGAAARRRRIPGRTRPARPPTADCGGPPTPHAARSASRRCSAIPRPGRGAARYPISGSRVSVCSARPDAARTQARSSARSAGRRPRVRRASRSSRIDAVSASPPGHMSGRDGQRQPELRRGISPP